jgi:Tannase and feruloyl esterase
MKKRYLKHAMLTAAGIICATQAVAQAEPGAKPAVQCSSLKDMRIAQGSIALPTGGAVVNSAVAKPATERKVTPSGIQLPLPEYCEVRGVIKPVDPNAPDINFQVSLPTAWNRYTMHYGGGGMNGNLVTGLSQRYPQPLDAPLPISRGYATFGSDSGHTNNGGDFTFDFALNDEALRNFGFEALKKTKDVAFSVINRYYGASPSKSFFAGHSNGGREALMVAQRFPSDYDGVLAVTPVLNFTGIQLSGNRLVAALSDGGWLTNAKIDLLTKSSLEACDESDGIKDQIIGRYMGCKHDPIVLRCPGGSDAGPSCLSDLEISTVKIYREPHVLPFQLAYGVTGFEGFGVSGRESFRDGWATWVTGKGAPARPQLPGSDRPQGQGNVPFFGQMFVRYFIAQDPAFDTYNFDPLRFRERIQKVSAIIDATNPDLSSFLERGGKLIITDNTGDSAQSGYSGIAYYDAVAKVIGRDRLSQGVRLYIAPGGSHYGIGTPSKFDAIGSLERWVVNGEAPGNLVAVDMDPATHAVGASRPLCEYPRYPHYKGSGDPARAENYECRSF